MINAKKLIEGLKKTCWGKSAHVIDDERRKAATVSSMLRDRNLCSDTTVGNKAKLFGSDS